jgi:hypothetical protein
MLPDAIADSCIEPRNGRISTSRFSVIILTAVIRR